MIHISLNHKGGDLLIRLMNGIILSPMNVLLTVEQQVLKPAVLKCF